MPNLEPIPRKHLHVFFILDTSTSMGGTSGKIEMLNRAMKETLEVLQQEARKNADAKLHVAVLEFNSGARWITANGPEDLEEDFIWDDLKAGGLTDMGMALTELDTKLSRNAWLNSMTGALMPIMIFMTDGHATDNYKKGLDQIRQNKWFEKGVKIGFAVGEDADANMIAEIVGNEEAVINTNDLELFRKLLVFVTVRSSMLQSKPRVDEDVSGADIVEEAKEIIKEKPAEDIDWDDVDFK